MGKPDLSMTINGCLAGLVAITASCAYVSVTSSIIIGFVAGLLIVLAVFWFDRRHIDDPVGALSVHLVNGVFGTLALGFFAEGRFIPNATGDGIFFGRGFKLFFAQLTGVASVAVIVFSVSFLIWYIIKKTIGMRVSEQEEMDGLDVGEHGMSAYPEFSVLSEH